MPGAVYVGHDDHDDHDGHHDGHDDDHDGHDDEHDDDLEDDCDDDWGKNKRQRGRSAWHCVYIGHPPHI